MTGEMPKFVCQVTGHTGRQQWLTCCCCWFVPPYIYIDVFTGCMPPNTASDRAQRRIESKLNSIRQSRVFKQWKRTKRSIQAPGYTFHTFRFKMDAKKWRHNRENLVSNLGSRWSVLVQGRVLKTLPKVVRHFVASRFETLLKSISFQK